MSALVHIEVGVLGAGHACGLDFPGLGVVALGNDEAELVGIGIFVGGGCLEEAILVRAFEVGELTLLVDELEGVLVADEAPHHFFLVLGGGRHGDFLAYRGGSNPVEGVVAELHIVPLVAVGRGCVCVEGRLNGSGGKYDPEGVVGIANVPNAEVLACAGAAHLVHGLRGTAVHQFKVAGMG